MRTPFVNYLVHNNFDVPNDLTFKQLPSFIFIKIFIGTLKIKVLKNIKQM